MTDLGIRLGHELPIADNILCSQVAEESRFHSVWIPEGWSKEAFTTLTAMSQSTKRVQLATGIVNVYSRSPALLAMTAATLDEASRGRVILGLGVSTAEIIQDWHGLHYERPLERAREYVSIIRTILDCETLSYSSKFFHLNRFKLGFKPFRPHIPIFLAALGPKMASLAGEVADGALLFLQPRHNLAEVRSKIEEGGEKVGRRPEEITVAQAIPISVSDEVEEARDSIRRVIAYYVGGAKVYNRLLSRTGFAREASLIRSAWKEGRREEARRLVTNDLLDSVAVAGSIQESIKGLRKFIEAGVKLPVIFVCQPRGETKAEYVCGLLRKLGAHLN